MNSGLLNGLTASAPRTGRAILSSRRISAFSSADLTRNSTSYVTDPAFAVKIDQGQTWRLHYRLFFVEGNGAGPKTQLAFTSMTVSAALGFGSVAGSASSNNAELILDGTNPALLSNNNDDSYHQIDYVVTLTATAGGIVNLQWGCSAAFDVTLNANSSVVAQRLS